MPPGVRWAFVRASAAGIRLILASCWRGCPDVRRKSFLIPALLALVVAGNARADDVVLRVSYLGKSIAFTAADMAAMPHEDSSAFDPHEKKQHIYSGVPVKGLLSQAGAPLGEKLRGAALSLVVVARPKDSYQVVYALAEFDESFSSRAILLVDREDGEPLGSAMGPVRIMVPGDKRAARWVRMVTSLEVVASGEAPRR